MKNLLHCKYLEINVFSHLLMYIYTPDGVEKSVKSIDKYFFIIFFTPIDKMPFGFWQLNNIVPTACSNVYISVFSTENIKQIGTQKEVQVVDHPTSTEDILSFFLCIILI